MCSRRSPGLCWSTTPSRANGRCYQRSAKASVARRATRPGSDRGRKTTLEARDRTSRVRSSRSRPATEPEEEAPAPPAHRCPGSRGDRPFDRRARRGRMDRMASDESAADLSRRKSRREVIASGDRGADRDATRSRAAREEHSSAGGTREDGGADAGICVCVCERPRHRHRPLRRTRRRRPSQQLPRGTGQGG